MRLSFNFKDKKSFVKEEFLTFRNSAYPNPVELFVSANVIFQDVIHQTFSLFHGMDFYNGFKHTIFGPIKVHNVMDLAKMPSFDEENVIAEEFDNIYQEQSGLTVYSVTSIVFIFRSLTKQNEKWEHKFPLSE